MFGWKGKILRVNLSTGDYGIENLREDLIRDFLGGRGIGVRIFYEEVSPKVDPLSPENKLIFCTGPLVGTGVPAGGRAIVVSKSPLTGAIANPNAGGYFGAYLKYAGYDFLIIEGKAPEPVYLLIKNEMVKIKPASHIWGKPISEAEKIIRKEEGEGDPWKENVLSVALIGPAGENLVKFSSIICDGGRTFGRSGLGAVMGSKNLKAIAVKGTGKVEVADPKGLRKAVLDFLREAKENGWLEKRSRWGTWELPARAQATGTLAALNFQRNYLESFKFFENPANLRDRIWVRDEGCFGCPFRCGKKTKISDPDHPGLSKGPEHESIVLLGSNCGISDLVAIWKANYLCNELGMDTITAGATISCVMELYEKGYIKESEIGFKLNFGNIEGTLELLKATAFREGFGAILAEGGYEVAEKYGHPELFMGSKKQGLPAWHPQGRIEAAPIMGLQYATSNVGACHTRSTLVFYPGQSKFKSLIEWTIHYQDFISAIDCCGLCWIIYHGPLWEEKPKEWLKLVTGIDYSEEELLSIGERVWNLERLFNLKAGFSRKDDSLPPRMYEKLILDKGYAVNLSQMLDEYYRLRGWDSNGIPTEAKISELGLKDFKIKKDEK
jgi:aldehyde:ferredoxin oxidoreductase